jgi:hypothetical protein
MRMRSLVGRFLAGLLVLATGGAASLAQYDSGSVYLPGRDGPPAYGSRRYQERVSPRYEARPRYVPGPQYGGQANQGSGYRAQPQYGARYQPAPPSNNFFFPWLQRPAEPAYEPEPRYRRRERPAAEPREVRRRAPRVAPAPEAREPAEKPAEAEVEPSIFVAVFGDSFADLVSKGLDDVFEENLDLEIVNKARGSSGLTRVDHYDWPKSVQEFLASGQKITFAVVMVGSNDRQVIREGETSHDPLSERWREIYRERVDAMIRPFVERRVPLLWVGLPPMRNERMSTDAIALNDIYRERVQKAGGVYVDIWEAFGNDENRYSPVGPDVDGQVTRLRSNDGIHFTRAGSRKAAHFVGVELKRLIEARGPGTNVAVAPSAPGADGSAVDRLVNTALPAVPDPQSLLPKPRPEVGPVVPLNRVDVSPGGALASAPPRLDPDTAVVVEKTLRNGVPPAPRSGRADDFTWPKQ